VTDCPWGENQATHLLLGIPYASTMGLLGSPVKPMIIPFYLNRNGQAITLTKDLLAKGVKTPQALKPLGVLRLSRAKMLRKVIAPAALPYVFTGWRLSLGIAWLVIVASEMLTGAPGIGGFLRQEYNNLVYSHILLSIITIGVIGFLLDRLMGVAERWFRMV
jgi:Binding-protein-dependent transport system inner membrane component/NMT1-like family